MLYEVSEKMGWNKDMSFPLEGIFRKYDKIYCSYEILLSLLPERNKGFNFLNENNWDYAVVLDACRYDLFKEINSIEGNLRMAVSVSSHTNEWIENIDTQRNDTVLITANPQLSRMKIREYYGKNMFYKNIPAWDIGWDEELNVTPPWTMYKISKRIVKKYENKRIIFWFMQPHYPFLTYKEPDETRIFSGKKNKLWGFIRAGDLSLEAAWKLYGENLKISLKYVDKLMDYLDGKIIITSDHGNCFGEMGLFGHPSGIHIPPLIDVPYLEIEK